MTKEPYRTQWLHEAQWQVTFAYAVCVSEVEKYHSPFLRNFWYEQHILSDVLSQNKATLT